MPQRQSLRLRCGCEIMVNTMKMRAERGSFFLSGHASECRGLAPFRHYPRILRSRRPYCRHAPGKKKSRSRLRDVYTTSKRLRNEEASPAPALETTEEEARRRSDDEARTPRAVEEARLARGSESREQETRRRNDEEAIKQFTARAQHLNSGATGQGPQSTSIVGTVHPLQHLNLGATGQGLQVRTPFDYPDAIRALNSVGPRPYVNPQSMSGVGTVHPLGTVFEPQSFSDVQPVHPLSVSPPAFYPLNGKPAPVLPVDPVAIRQPVTYLNGEQAADGIVVKLPPEYLTGGLYDYFE